MSSSPASDPPVPVSAIAVKRYSLAAMMRELKADRANKAFTMEKLDRTQIDDIFRRPAPSAHGSNPRVS